MIEHIEYAREWLGTPFHIQGAVKGVGVDCCFVVFDALARAGVIKPISMPPYRLDNVSDPGATAYPLLLSSILPPHAFTSADDIQAGDVLIYRFDGRVRHISIATSPTRHIHTSYRYGVIETEMTRFYTERLHRIHRIIHG